MDAQKSTSKRRRTVKQRIVQYLPHEIWRMIFTFLNASDLSKVKTVSRSWAKAAKDEMRTRGPVCNSWEDSPGNVTDYTMYSIMNQLNIKPKLGIFWGIDDLKKCPVRWMPDYYYAVTMMANSGGEYLCGSPDETYVYSYLYDIPYESDDRCPKPDIWNFGSDDMRGKIHTLYAFLPRTVGVKVKPYFMFPQYSVGGYVEKFVDRIKRRLNRPTLDKNAGRCVLLFTSVVSHPGIKDVVDLFIAGGDSANKFCLWGGTVREISIHTPKRCVDKVDFCGAPTVCAAIVITGAFQCWSMIMADTHDTVEKIEKKLVEFRNKVHLNRRSMGFMFTCNYSLCRANRERKGKRTIFKKVFPGVPLLNCYGQIMFGNNTVEDNSNDKDTSGYNLRSTAFMIITYNV